MCKTIDELNQAVVAAHDQRPLDPELEGSIAKPAVQKGKRIQIAKAMGPSVTRREYKAIQVRNIKLTCAG